MSSTAVAPATPASHEAPPSLRKPSQAYVDQYIARRGGTPITPSTEQAIFSGARGQPTRLQPRIFVKLDKECPNHYYPPLNTTASSLKTIRSLLLFLCAVQFVVALGVLYIIVAKGFFDRNNDLFAKAVALLYAFAACAGGVGVLASSRSMLLLLYINQLWGLSCLSTFAVLQLTSEEQGMVACDLLPKQQLREAKINCALFDEGVRLLLGLGLVLLAALLWAVCYLSRVYSEGLQDKQNDDTDLAIIDFIWQRRGETWERLERFEEVVQRQFEELRMSLVAHAHTSARTQQERPAADGLRLAGPAVAATTPAARS
jgi:hypothetical protein